METDDQEEIFPTVVDHAWNPRNLGQPETFNGHARIKGPCGDTMEFWVLVHRGIIENASFTTDGCEPSLACGSMTTCLARGKTLEAAMELRQQDVLDALAGLSEENRHCALLAVNTLIAACGDCLTNQQGEHDKQNG